ncbi:hypothetical protein LPJ77_002015 [Coemansia sp. RSA 2523]|nr:hypothetical protein LPJ58_000968 [Coemansia sp. RSA 1591]KAJ1766265.1 hypothetical protein LPJ69_000946 [Coemansia sp. RSA 1752]KAJ1775434.1 hypothetical protein LPJ54_003700 [Coemansia sp. RSA 1824]KAJ1790729.1 hypothetical protein LPJ62_001778 [Coemansia sp. RSA 2167]KAJ1794321.1 hypothetical protein LPJ67_000827 [Coemansia sp. RSA 1938]KAJ1808920.1 hypothetical protein LPJ77_002015 [Coemansia sp. RSA 2523]KAJ2146201.1 hypothetical protein IW142_002212 [Coemansia sp. RSA 564]KAJ2154142
MEVIDRQEALITNYEALMVLREADVLNEADKRKQKDTARHMCPENVTTLRFEALAYLEKTACTSQSGEQLAQLKEQLLEYELTKGEILQILNLRPKSVVELHLLVEDCTERFLVEEIEQLVSIILEVLPSDGDEAVQHQDEANQSDAMDVDN